MDISYHFPPELMSLLIDTIPRLVKSKIDILLFFRGAGVNQRFLSECDDRLRADPKSIDKFQITRTVLKGLNEAGEACLRERREILKRVVEFDDFSACWDNDRLKAQGLVAQIQKLVNVKDAFTRIHEEHEKERSKSIARREQEIQAIQAKKQVINLLKTEFYSLFGEKDRQRRGKALEDVFNRLLAAYDVEVTEAFTLTGDAGEGIVEQIDGVIRLNNRLYFVEMKWWSESIGVPQISEHMTRIFLRPEGHAIVLSASPFTAPAIAICKEAFYKGKLVTLFTLEEIVRVLVEEQDLKVYIQRKIDAHIAQKNPFPSISAAN